MYKEILTKRLREGHSNRRTVPLEELPRLANELTAVSSEIMVGQDTWSDASRSQLQDYDFWIDIDSPVKNDQPAPKLLGSSQSYCLAVVETLATAHHVPLDKLRIYFSGRRGFHLLLPFRLARPVRPDRLHSVVKDFCRELISSIKSQTATGASMDLQLYGGRHVIRAPWSPHASGLRKVPISAEELHLPATRLLQVLKERSASFKPPVDWSWLTEKPSDATFTRAILQRITVTTSLHHTGVDDLGHPIERQFEKDARCMVCFADLPNLPARLDFNRSKMFLLSMLKTLGVPYDGALEGAKGFAERLSDRLCSPPAKRRERITEVESAARTAYRSTTGKYEFNTPGRCSRLLPTTIGRPDAVATYCNLCPRYRPDFQPEEYYRLHLKWLLKQKITAEALRIYLELAVNGPAPDMSSLAARTRLTSHKIRNAVKQLVSRKLASETPAGRTKVYSALRPVQKSIGAKN